MSAPPFAFDFVKAEGLGNDFLIVDARGQDLNGRAAELQAMAAQVCDRRLGVGADGILVVGGPTLPGSTATMRVINADGSRPQMCGNGLRCVALWLASDRPTTMIVDTDAGPRHCNVEPGPLAEVVIDMGAAQHGPEVDTPRADGHRLTQVSMGNPHAIAFVTDADPEALARRLGPGLEHDPAFPEGTNVEFARIDGEAITLWVWERGCGITAACGTGACATAAAAVANGTLPADCPIRVRLPGGDLWITVPADPHAGVRMRGPARLVYRGMWL